jgi:hypothetical protein
VSTGLSNEPGSREPGLDQLIRALTVEGHPRELAGRDAALIAFRAAQARPPKRARLPLPHFSARLSAVAAALVVAFAGLTAAAYAQALPAPMQQIAYNLFAPLGVPSSHSAPGGSPNPVPGSASGGPSANGNAPTSPSASSSASASCPCPAKTTRPAIKGSALALSAARQQLPANGWDVFTGKLTYHGRAEAGVRIRLLEQVAGGTGWRQVGNGVTGGRGGVRINVPHVTRNATFRLASRNGVGSATVTVTVIPRVLLWRAPAQPGTDKLVVAAHFGDPGDVVTLEELSSGTWQSVTTRTLDSTHQASFARSAAQAGGHYYRVLLQATGTHGASVSQSVFVPRAKAAIGARAIEPHPGVPGHGKRRRGVPGPVGPTVPGSGTPSPGWPGPGVPGPGPGPIPGPVPGPVTPTVSPSPSASSTAAA